MKGYFINVKDGFSEVVDVKDCLEVFYEKIDCTTIDIVNRKIGGVYYAIVCDDEGLYAERVTVSAATKAGDPVLVGNLLIFKNGKDGELAGLSGEDVERVRKNIYLALNDKRAWPIVQVEY